MPCSASPSLPQQNESTAQKFRLLLLEIRELKRPAQKPQVRAQDSTTSDSPPTSPTTHVHDRL